MSKKVLIVCFFFPPYPSIGGRRSAKFAKYLVQKGYDVHVIMVKNPFQETSSWMKDIEKLNLHIYELPLNYPKEFILPVTTLFQKIKYRFTNSYFNLFLSKKNKFDYTVFWKNDYSKKVKTLIEEDEIENIFISAPPFYYIYYTCLLKKQFPNINIIADFRDPWLESPYYGMSGLKQNQLKHEIDLFNEVAKGVNYITGPNEILLARQASYLKKENESFKSKFITIEHAYDPDDVLIKPNNHQQSVDYKIRLVYGGQLYTGTEPVLKELSEFLKTLKVSNYELYKKLSIEFYTPEVDRAAIFKGLEDVVTFSASIGNKIMDKIATATFCLLFMADHNKDFRTTKFLEYAILRKPFIVFGNKGYVAKFVEENKIGVACDAATIKEVLLPLLSDHASYISNRFNKNLDLSQYSFDKMTDKLISLFSK